VNKCCAEDGTVGLYQSSFTVRMQTMERDAIKQAKKEERRNL
jgi:hypothetical protein